ncbi:F-actin-uncapping protein LRRC16A-like isoform X2 [Anneissia japonica]|uniref:F-actin-uncapping protein LRRC16A-like isoform X2 n=1 Tax=Anneissia japonica TaxID=1529436 RepID=UPI001425B6D2|nr:F-actin-uncapping protein LRRC16A-like isoform X2 [Anneissia japonica]
MGSSDESMEIVREVLKDKFQHGLVKSIKSENKQGKIENGKLALSAYRAFVILATKSTKHLLEHEFNYLEIKGIESEKDKQVKFVLENGKIINISTSSVEETDCLIEYLTTSLLKVFPQTPILKLISSLKLEPNARQTELMDKLENLPPADVGPCGGFSRMYACMCDHLKLTYMPEVAWDIETIYLSQNCKNLCLNDFDHLNQRDLTPIIAALEYNTFFTQLSGNSLKVKLVVEAVKAIVHVLKKSAIEKLVLVDCNLKHEFAHGLNTALLANTKCSLTHLDLSQNPIEDRGLQAMSDRLAKLPDGLAVLKLAKTGITGKGASFMFKTFYECERMANVLQVLDVSHASFKEHDLTDLKSFLARPNALTHLDLSFTGLALDEIFNALVRGCLLKLSHLNLSGNTFTTKKAKPAAIPQSIKNFFASAMELKVVGLAGNKLPPEVVKEVILAISMNKNITDIELDLSSNELKAAGCLMLESVIACVGNIRSLDISDNDINDGLASFLDWVCENKTLRVLNVSKNLIRAKSLDKVMDAFVKLIQEEELPLENLSMADCHLNYETIVIINALGSNTSLTSIDFSGNNMRDLGAKMLAKALMINSKLEFVNCDRNNITADGYREIANALERNYTLKEFPMPVHDIHNNSRQDCSKLEAPLHRIQQLIQRNHSSRKFIDDQAFRLQQGFLYTTAHQMVDKMVVQIQDKAMELESQDSDVVKLFVEEGEKYIKDADNSKKLLAMMHDVALKSSLVTVESKLKSLASEVQQTVQSKLKETLNSMLDCAEEQCETVMEKPEIKSELLSAVEERAVLPDRFMQDVLDQAAADISNKISEVHLAMAAQISDTVVGDILANLEDCFKNLSEHAENVPSLDKPNKESFLDDEKFDATEVVNEAPISEPPVNPALSRVKDEHLTKRTTKRGIRPKSIIPQDKIDMGVEPVTPPGNVQPFPEFSLPQAVPVPTPPPVTTKITPLKGTGFSGEVTTLVSLTKTRPKKPQRTRPTRPTVQPPNLPESEVKNEFTNLEGFYTVVEDKAEKKKDKKEDKTKDKKKKTDEPKPTAPAKQEKKSVFGIFKRNKRDKSPSQGKPQSKKKEDSKEKKAKAAEDKKKKKVSKDITPAVEEKPTPPPAENKPTPSPAITEPVSPPLEEKPTPPVAEEKPEKKPLKPPGGMGFGNILAKTDLDKHLNKRKSSPLLVSGKEVEPDKPNKKEDEKPTVDQIQEGIPENPLNDIKSDLKAEIEKNGKEPSAVELTKNVEEVDDSDKKSEPTEEKEENTPVKAKELKEENTEAEEVANKEIKSVGVTNGKDSEPVDVEVKTSENNDVPVAVENKDEVKVVAEEANNENKQENTNIVKKDENFDTTDGNKKEITQPIEKLNEEENELPQTELKTETETETQPSSKISLESEGNTTVKETESTEVSTEESAKEKEEGKKEEKDEKKEDENEEKKENEKDEKREEIHNASEEISDKIVNVVNKDVTKICTDEESTEKVPDVNGTKENTDTTESTSAPKVETAKPVSPESDRPNLLSINVDSASSENNEQKSPIKSPSRPTPSPRPTAAPRPKSAQTDGRPPPVTKPRPTSMKPSPSTKPKPKKSNSTLQMVIESNVANAETNGTSNGDVKPRSEKSPPPSKPPVRARPKSIENSPSKNSPDVADKNFSPKKE